MKSDVFKMANYLNILQDIQDAPPTDGLWDDGRTDEDQIGMTYDDLEKCMRQDDMGTIVTIKKDLKKLETYKKMRKQNMHKMEPIPVCNMEKFR
jgi:NAD+ synthase